MYTKNRTDLITIEELCSTLSIGKNTAYSLLKDKKITAFRIGRIWKIPRSSVADYIQNQCTNLTLQMKV